ncbi:MAG TPA: hypothetical protein VGJ05_22135, partial [Fimbriiglobus sp.]
MPAETATPRSFAAKVAHVAILLAPAAVLGGLAARSAGTTLAVGAGAELFFAGLLLRQFPAWR